MKYHHIRAILQGAIMLLLAPIALTALVCFSIILFFIFIGQWIYNSEYASKTAQDLEILPTIPKKSLKKLRDVWCGRC